MLDLEEKVGLGQEDITEYLIPQGRDTPRFRVWTPAVGNGGLVKELC